MHERYQLHHIGCFQYLSFASNNKGEKYKGETYNYENLKESFVA